MSVSSSPPTKTPPISMPVAKPTAPPRSQEKPQWRKNWPMWAKDLPRFRFPPMNENFQLLDMGKLNEVLKNADAEAAKRIQADIQYMEHEVLRLFRERDYEAKFHQNRYRLYQIGFISLAASATLFGSLQGLALKGNPTILPFFSFIETIIALLATFLATLAAREPPLTLYLSNRRRAESLRREYFRFLMNIDPYTNLDGPARRQLLSRRAADKNRGLFPENE